MESIVEVLKSNYSLCLFIAPPAWGKTRILVRLLESGRPLVFFSPLRALAEEFAKSLGKLAVMCPSRSEFKETFENWRSGRPRAFVVTPEIIESSIDEILDVIKEKEAICVLDEFHLFFRWGLSFRPVLFETLLSLFSEEMQVLGLTATVDDFMKNELDVLLPHLGGMKWKLDFGNLILLHPPDKIKYYPSNNFGRQSFMKAFQKAVDSYSNTVLLFVPYRAQVDYFVERLRRIGVTALGCVGGEVQQFVKELDIQNPPKVIVSTSTLSHGVNLPTIDGVFIDYKLDDPTFWIQMVGRGGRRGDAYELHTFDTFNTDFKMRLKSIASLFFMNPVLAIRQFFEV